ncbi:MAG: hypothetical protein IJB75_06560 [Oscillospiraceae bacterium]|nr:hypothetical protein [Oscillospiraceae bacterium]
MRGAKKTVSLILPQETYDKLKRLANEDYRSVPSYLRVMINNNLRRLESAPKEND